MQTDPQYKLRLPVDLKEKIKKASEYNHRSMNAEIVARLEESFRSEAIDNDWQSPVSTDDDYLLGDAKQILSELDGVMERYRRLQEVRAGLERRMKENKGEG